jgi:hypothetical protein
VFPSQAPLAVPRDQFSRSTSNLGRRSVRWGQILLLVPAIVVGVIAYIVRTQMVDVAGGLLTVTSILTGFTFAMANTFWSKSIEARRDPRWSVDSAALDVIDDSRNHMIWTVVVGVATVGILTVYTIFSTTVVDGRVGEILQAGTRVAAAVTASLVFYTITLVAGALRTFNRAVAILKA